MECTVGVLSVSTSWDKKTSKLINDFCKKSLKKEPHELSRIHCTVLDDEVHENLKKEAERCGVNLIPAIRPKWSTPVEDPPAITWLLNHANYYPGLAKLDSIAHVVGLLAKTNNSASAIHESLFPKAQLHLLKPDPSGIALFVYDAWNEDELGLTGFHRNLVQDFCERKAKAGETLKAYSTVLNVEISDKQKKDAESCGVILIPAQLKERADPKDEIPELKWLLNHDIYYPDLKDLESVEYVVGYAPKTGLAAADIRAQLFPDAKLVLINHACPETDCLQAEEYGIAEFEEKMLRMACEADLLFSIGPRIHQYFQNAYRADTEGRELSEIPHEEILPQLSDAFWTKHPKLQQLITQHNILTYGQIDTKETIKQCLSMATLINAAAMDRKKSNTNPPKWKIQGASKKAFESYKALLGDKTTTGQILPTFQTSLSAKTLLTSLQQCHLCIPMPCYTDYSFHGLEAMVFGLPTYLVKNSDIAYFIKKYFGTFEHNWIVECPEENLSKKILQHLSNTSLEFQKAKALKKSMVENEAVTTLYAKFASLLTVKKPNADEHKEQRGNIPQQVGETDKPSTQSKAVVKEKHQTENAEPCNFTLTEDDIPTAQKTVQQQANISPGYETQRLPKTMQAQSKIGVAGEPQLTQMGKPEANPTHPNMIGKEGSSTAAHTQPELTGRVDMAGGETSTSVETTTQEQDSLTVHIQLDDKNYCKCLEEQGKAPSAQPRVHRLQEMMSNLEAAWRYCKQALKRKAENVVGDKDAGCQLCKKICKKELGDDVDPTNLTAESLGMLIRFLTLYNLYKLKQTCRSGSLAKAFEPLLITDEMIEIADKVGLKLQLKATYDTEKFKEVELFFINRDGGGIQPVSARFKDNVFDDENVDNTTFDSHGIDIREGMTDIHDRNTTETVQTDNDQSDPQQEKDVAKLLLIEVNPALDIKSFTESAVQTMLKAENCIRLQGRQCNILQVPTSTDTVQHILSHRQDILALLGVTRYLLTDGASQDMTTQALEAQLTRDGVKVLTPPVRDENVSLVARSLLPREISQIQITDYIVELSARVSEKDSKIDLQNSVLKHQLDEATKGKATLEEQITDLTQKLDSNEKSFMRQIQSMRDTFSSDLEEKEKTISDLEAMRETFSSELEEKEKIIRDLEAKLAILGHQHSKDSEDVKEITDTRMDFALTKTNIPRMDDQMSKPEMARRDNSEMETATSTQPKTGREGSEMEATTHAQPWMPGEVGRKDTKNVPIAFLSERPEHEKEGQVAKLEKEQKHEKHGKKDSSGIFSRMLKLLYGTGGKDKTNSSAAMSGSKEERSGLVAALGEELPISEMSSGTVIPFSTEEQTGLIAVGRGKLSSGPKSSEMFSGTKMTHGKSGRWSRRTLKGHQGHKFKFVKGLAFHTGKLLVCDSDNNIVHILNQDYTCEKELGSFTGQFAKPFKPESIAVSQDNLCFILDDNNMQIVVCDQDNKVIKIISLPTDSDLGCIALVKGFVIVTQVKSHRVLKYSQDGQFIAQVGGQGDGKTQFTHPRFVTVNSRNVIMVSDYGNHCIKCFDAEFNYLFQFGRHGRGDGQLFFPRSIALDGADNIYVCDHGNGRISVWSRDGSWTRHLFQDVMSLPQFMAVTADGDRIAVCGSPFKEIIVFSM
ncbi:uncharacterized protein [Ptychodera flava]|uniref:uncharacterized protein n=1 Tax=Ptychodera flava TaxID=63121 RepID=UPI00396A2C2F